MTRNLYLGADINGPLVAASTAYAEGGTTQDVLVALAHATQLTGEVVGRTDFRVRAPLLADEIARTRPDLVGLQEVALWRSGPLDLGGVGVPRATEVDHDFLRILLDELADRGLDYTAAQVGTRADVETPSFDGSPFDGTVSADARNVRLTMRDVILVRVDDALQVTGSGDTVYADNLAASVPGITVCFDRGCHWVDVTVGETGIRFVNTHLEAFSSDLALAQAAELLDAATASDRTTILVGDFNSDPLSDGVYPLDQVSQRAPYDLITGQGGFTDEWLLWAPADAGWTSGLSELVDDPTARFDHRIDMVFARTPRGRGLSVAHGEVTGTNLADRDSATGLWPSDHGGVLLRLLL
jgi:endonuclease/exonuclease/phosphatase family metal-dependent hydrolase